MYQLYLSTDHDESARALQKVEQEGINAVMFTVDSAVLGNRERDTRAQRKGNVSVMSPDVTANGTNLSWDDIAWYKGHCSLPLFLKGVQSPGDVQQAARMGVHGVMLSNYGGPSLDYAPNSVDVLIELRDKHIELLGQIEVYIDGGVRRGTDVLKARPSDSAGPSSLPTRATARKA